MTRKDKSEIRHIESRIKCLDKDIATAEQFMNDFEGTLYYQRSCLGAESAYDNIVKGIDRMKQLRESFNRRLCVIKT